jgi:hypothetical protein
VDPHGRPPTYEECRRICREHSPKAAWTMIRAMEFSQDEKTRLWAAKTLYEWAWGTARPMPVENDKEEPRLSALPPEQRRKRIAELLAWAASIKVPADFRPPDVIDTEPADNDDERE